MILLRSFFEKPVFIIILDDYTLDDLEILGIDDLVRVLVNYIIHKSSNTHFELNLMLITYAIVIIADHHNTAASFWFLGLYVVAYYCELHKYTSYYIWVIWSCSIYYKVSFSGKFWVNIMVAHDVDPLCSFAFTMCINNIM